MGSLVVTYGEWGARVPISPTEARGLATATRRRGSGSHRIAPALVLAGMLAPGLCGGLGAEGLEVPRAGQRLLAETSPGRVVPLSPPASGERASLKPKLSPNLFAPPPNSSPRSAPPSPRRGPETPPPPPPAVAPAPLASESRRIKVRTETGHVTVARVHGQDAERVSVLLPDGQIRFASGLALTDDPFVPSSVEEMRGELVQGPFARFEVLQTPHYVVLYQSTQKFAEASAKLLEDLYKGLSEALRKREVPIHEAEFPMVAVIFRTEADFRAHKPVDRDVQAYYEILSNRIYFYQNSERDQYAPEVAALRRPQTVAHEGTHQILSNIGIQPRLGAWPLWLVEGLAEYCSPPVSNKKGTIAWKGLGAVNALHMATIRDLEDPASIGVRGAEGPRIGRDPKKPLVEYLVTRTELTPTDYALSWAMTHYLAQKRGDAFVAFLKKMSRMPPLEKHSPEDQLTLFREAFGADLAKLDKAIGNHLGKVKYEPLPYYAVMFEQPLGLGRIKRAAIVSQSPSMIRQWVETLSSPNGGEPHWVAEPYPNKSRAVLVAEQWIGNRLK